MLIRVKPVLGSCFIICHYVCCVMSPHCQYFRLLYFITGLWLLRSLKYSNVLLVYCSRQIQNMEQMAHGRNSTEVISINMKVLVLTSPAWNLCIHAGDVSWNASRCYWSHVFNVWFPNRYTKWPNVWMLIAMKAQDGNNHMSSIFGCV